jgi:hypothetical protein
MGTRYFLCLVSLISYGACGRCDEDMYGDHLELVIPMTTYPSQDTFHIGDTLWVEFNIDKNVALSNTDKSIRLDSFDFFSKFYIAEISDTISNYDVNMDTFILKGKLEYLPLTYVTLYPITYVETVEEYQFKMGVVINEPGLYYIGMDTNPDLYEFHNHPALFTCEDNKRKSVDIYYHNTSTSLATFENIFKQTNVEYLRDLVDYEDYSRGGAIAIVVL